MPTRKAGVEIEVQDFIALKGLVEYNKPSSNQIFSTMFFSQVQDLQRPTHPRLRIRDSRDAHIVLEAVRHGVLQRIERRLNEGERSMFIRSGAVFVWEESDEETGIKRWTDGRMWTQSRAKDPFLFYEVSSRVPVIRENIH